MNTPEMRSLLKRLGFEVTRQDNNDTSHWMFFRTPSHRWIIVWEEPIDLITPFRVWDYTSPTFPDTPLIQTESKERLIGYLHALLIAKD